MTEQAKHTPGPWWYGKMGNGKPVIRCRAPEGKNGIWHDIAVVQLGRSAMHTFRDREASEVEANARLIAAAPTMYDELVAIRNDRRLWDYLDTHYPERCEAIIAAIAKAKGVGA